MEEKEKSTSFFRFEDLRIYDKAIEYNRWIVNTLKNKQSRAQEKIQDTFVGASLAICSNIAEGSYRSKNQFESYLKVAKASIRECVVYTSCAYKASMLSQEDYHKSRELLMELTKMLGALIISLQRNNKASKKELAISEEQKDSNVAFDILNDDSFSLDF
jgi:four helix bundle protein